MQTKDNMHDELMASRHRFKAHTHTLEPHGYAILTDDVDEAVAEVTKFYSNFHSYRYIGDKLVIRMQRELTKEHMLRLKNEFSYIVKSGGFEQGKPLPDEKNQPELDSLPRLIFRHRRRDFGRLREFINAVND